MLRTAGKGAKIAAKEAPKAIKSAEKAVPKAVTKADDVIKAAKKAVIKKGETVKGWKKTKDTLEKLERKHKVETNSKVVTSTLKRKIDVTPALKHSTVDKNPGPYGVPNSSVDILDKRGNVKTRRWYDLEGKAIRDVDMGDHGNPKEHPEVPHEHIWEYINGKPKRN